MQFILGIPLSELGSVSVVDHGDDYYRFECSNGHNYKIQKNPKKRDFKFVLEKYFHKRWDNANIDVLWVGVSIPKVQVNTIDMCISFSDLPSYKAEISQYLQRVFGYIGPVYLTTIPDNQ